MSPHGKLVLGGLSATAILLLVASALSWSLGLPTCIAAVMVTTIVSLKTSSNPISLLREISWTTLLLVAGLFVMVEAVESVGALRFTEMWLHRAEALWPSIGALIAGFVLGVCCNLLNNLPLGLIAGSTLQLAQAKALTASAVMMGVDLGPNLSITGSLATILWLIALRKHKLEVSFWSFLKVGAIVMPLTLLLSLGAAIVMQLIFAK